MTAQNNLRSAELDWRISLHESTHCVCSRYYNLPLGGASLQPIGPYAGMAWGPAFKTRSALDQTAFDGYVDIITEARRLMPGVGESQEPAAEFIVLAKARIVELLAATEGERLLFPEKPPLGSTSDQREARARAELICEPEAVDAYLEYARVEAAAIIARSAPVVLALARELVARRTMNGEEIDAVIERARLLQIVDEARECRAKWSAIVANAKTFRSNSN